MQLTRLEIKGFKSFGDKITINFNEGVTAIVGPNGCGKSNVVDAIRWVLGEQRTKNLRSEKMENIIFNGTKTRKSANLAEVSLSFDNTKNVLPTEFSQVTITRKLYRSGESEYRLNDVQCRLKDITDLFLDTGIGNDSYSIIELKMIDEIINNKENSRRALFEEASGISKYKVRKKQTLNKLKDTESDLDRVEDLLFEIEKNLKSLENQAKKAERYYRLKDQYKELSITLASFRIANFREALMHLDEQQNHQDTERNTISAQLDVLEATLQKLKQSCLTQEKNLSVQQKAANEYTSKIRTYESEKKVKNEQLRNLNDKEQRLHKELTSDKQQINHILYNIKRLNEELLAEQLKLDEIKVSLDEQKQEVDELRGQQQNSKAKLDHANRESNELQNNIYKLEKEITVLHIQKDALTQESERNIIDTEAKETALDEFTKVVVNLEERVAGLQEEYNQVLSFEEGLSQRIITKESLIQSHKDELAKGNRTLDAKQNEYNLTKSLVDNLEGYPESIRFLRKNAGWAKPYPLLSDILFCKEEYRVAIENFLEPLMNHYVVNKRAEAINAIKLLTNASRGRAGFFVLEALTDTTPENTTIENTRMISALAVVDADQKYRPLIQALLNHVYILKADDEADLETDLPDTPMTILHKNGKFAKFRLGLNGGSVGLFEGKRIGRAKNLDNLNKEIKQITQHLEKLQKTTLLESEELNNLKADTKKEVLEETKLQLNRLNNELISVKTKQEQYVTFIENSQNRKHDIATKIAAITQDLLASEPRLNSLNKQKITQHEELLRLQENFNEVSERLTMLSSAFNQENIKFHQQQNKVNTIHKDLEYRESQHHSLEKRIAQYTTEYQQVKEDIKDTLQHVDHSDEDLIAMYAEKELLEKALQESEQDYYATRGSINKKDEEITALRKRKEHFDLLTNEIKDKKTTLRLELNTLKERLSVEFDIDINDLLDNELSESLGDEDELRARTEKLKKQLEEFGSINSMAMEAFQEINERYTFIQKERKDLFDAKASLLETIKEIDDTARDKFMEAFTKVRAHFITVFRSLFNEEDSCDLVLSKPDAPLESDIEIMARPKGKRPLSINQLSGGEKTLTSTALLFSLYLLKPAPFCIFDEVDAPLDDTNIDKFNNIIRKFSNQSQFIIVSHNKRTIASTDIIYGVTMVEQGVSRVVAVDMREV
ncbi:chromosome segregation protein SMC [Olivibacter sp. SDN3]|uniref:chromosome segregation protein SMC n=1 Tax=Olivibacter sp. SDN3 TaxID=2764720 RepID=UPI0016516890|nr:chromosome segregation protein SMC [Olivibacter sp. SDN3]QNL48508.1 chromosome segregation protein SMC [Olivibacter sp. SDN3]